MQKKALFFFIYVFSIFSSSLIYAVDDPKELSQAVERLNAIRVDGLRALDTHNYRKAVEIFNEALKLKPQKWLSDAEYNEILLNLSEAEVLTKQYKSASKHLSELIEAGLNPALIYYRDILKAHIMYGEGRAQSCMRKLNAILTQKPLKEWRLIDQKFYLKVKGGLEHYYEDLFTQAERCYEGGMYLETIPLYYEILEAISEGVYPLEPHSKLPFQLRSRIAYSEFNSERYLQAKEILEENKKLYPILFEPESFQRLIVCCKELKDYDRALSYCDEFVTYKYSPSKKEGIEYERACIYFHKKDFVEAKKLFSSLIEELKDKNYVDLSRFYMAKILLEEKNYDEVEKVLHPDHFRFQADSVLRPEWAYLRAEALFYRKQYEMSAAGFKESLSKTDKSSYWKNNALYHLGFCYLKLGEDKLLQTHSRKDFFERAEAAFEELLKTKSDDRTHLALSRAYLMQHHYLQDSQANQKVHRLLKNYKFEAIESKLEAGFILADMTANREQREKIYDVLTSDAYQDAQNYGKAWYFRGIFLSQSDDVKNDREMTYEALSCFAKGYEALAPHYPKLAEACLKHQIEGYLNFNELADLQAGCDKIDELSSQNLSVDTQYRLGCLKAQICLKMIPFNQKKYFFEGVEALEHAEAALKDHEAHDQALFLKGKLFYEHGDYQEAKVAFSTLCEKKPHSSYCPEALFWIAESNDLSGGSKITSRELRQRIYQEHPDHPLAAEAYFLCYQFPEYLEGQNEALMHLKALDELFPKSPYRVASSYLLGLSQKQSQVEKEGQIIEIKDLNLAIGYFEKAKAAFDDSYQKGMISEANLHYFTTLYYRSILAEAQCYLEKADDSSRAKRHLAFQKAQMLFNEICEQFETSEQPLASLMKVQEAYPKIYEEAEFGRAVAFAKNGDIEEAEEAFGSVIEHYSQIKADEGHYLSRSWYELALMAIAKQEYAEAIDYLSHAEQTMHRQMINSDYKIGLGIEQSLCYRFLGQLDMAMLTLSKVINEGVVSNLRVKAMVLRSEIYQMQGRQDLAQKQLEAAAKKGGEWAQVAQEKLVKEYGYN